jgi:methylenetetrahydrofolate reductase (NADPH)
MVLASAGMARKLSAENEQLKVPPDVLARLDDDPSAGVALACQLAEQVRHSGAFDGVHLVPVSRYREVALALEQQGWRRGR